MVHEPGSVSAARFVFLLQNEAALNDAMPEITTLAAAIVAVVSASSGLSSRSQEGTMLCHSPPCIASAEAAAPAVERVRGETLAPLTGRAAAARARTLPARRVYSDP